jgi:hypothetical protein
VDSKDPRSQKVLKEHIEILVMDSQVKESILGIQMTFLYYINPKQLNEGH